jgi:hypothetical protein
MQTIYDPLKTIQSTANYARKMLNSSVYVITRSESRGIDSHGQKLGLEFQGLRGSHQLRVTRDFVGGRKFLYRKVTCWSSECAVGRYDTCVTYSDWHQVHLKANGRAAAAAVAAIEGDDQVVASTGEDAV